VREAFEFEKNADGGLVEFEREVWQTESGSVFFITKARTEA
jgi:hypothetical protein